MKRPVSYTLKHYLVLPILCVLTYCSIGSRQTPRTSFAVEHASSVHSYTQRGLLHLARAISSSYPYVQLMFLNKAYLSITKSWICNMQILSNSTLKQTIFVVSDEETAYELEQFEPTLAIYVHPSNTADVSYGTLKYFELTLARLRLQNQLIQEGMNVFLVEADSIWFSPMAEYMSKLVEVDKASIVSVDPLISAGFIFFSASHAQFFAEYTNEYAKIILKLRGSEGRVDHIHAGEQHLMTEMLRERNHSVVWLDECHFARGEWYQDEKYRIRCPHPKVIQNNYLVGNAEKVTRAKEWNHWFLDGDGQCLRDIPLVNPHADFNLTCSTSAFLSVLGSADATSGILDKILILVDQVFYLVEKAASCSGLKVSSDTATRVTCVVGTVLDECLFKERELMDYAELVTAAHGYVHQYSHHKQFNYIAVLEEDATFDVNSLHEISLASVIPSLRRLMNSDEWNIIRFGRLPYFLVEQSAVTSCPVECICKQQNEFGNNLCHMRHPGCDMRSSDFYVSSSRIFLKLAEMVNDDNRYPCQRVENRKVGIPMATPRPTIDLQILKRIDHQWYLLPQLSMQKKLRHLGVVHGHLEGVHQDVALQHQRRLDSVFTQFCFRNE